MNKIFKNKQFLVRFKTTQVLAKEMEEEGLVSLRLTMVSSLTFQLYRELFGQSWQPPDGSSELDVFGNILE